MNIYKLVQQLALLVSGLAAGAASADYVGLLKLPGAPSASTGFYSFSSIAPTSVLPSFSATDPGYRLKLGYKYSRYLAVESEYIDFGSAASGGAFANPASLASGFRSTGVGIDTIATLPLWRFSFYGRLGAYSGSRNMFSMQQVSLLADSARTRVRYGLGMRYDFTKALGIRAELERYTPAFTGESEADLFSVGLSWRF